MGRLLTPEFVIFRRPLAVMHAVQCRHLSSNRAGGVRRSLRIRGNSARRQGVHVTSHVTSGQGSRHRPRLFLQTDGERLVQKCGSPAAAEAELCRAAWAAGGLLTHDPPPLTATTASASEAARHGHPPHRAARPDLRVCVCRRRQRRTRPRPRLALRPRRSRAVPLSVAQCRGPRRPRAPRRHPCGAPAAPPAHPPPLPVRPHAQERRESPYRAHTRRRLRAGAPHVRARARARRADSRVPRRARSRPAHEHRAAWPAARDAAPTPARARRARLLPLPARARRASTPHAPAPLGEPQPTRPARARRARGGVPRAPQPARRRARRGRDVRGGGPARTRRPRRRSVRARR